MILWLPITFAAAAVQTLRFMLQKRLKGAGLSVGGATARAPGSRWWSAA